MTTIYLVVTSHTKTLKHKRWNTVKGRVIQRFGTVRAAALALHCHFNSVRHAAEGRCPNVRGRMKKLGLL